MPNRFPRGDADFLAAINEFFKYISNNQAALSLTAADVGDFNTLTTNYSTALDLQNSLENQKQAATADKNFKRKALEDAANRMTNEFQADAAVTDAMLEAMGLDAPDTTPTAVGVPTTRPLGQVDTAQRLEHRIEFVDETSTTTNRRAKPDGVRGCQVWVKIGGAPPVDIKECGFLAEDTRSPYIAIYTGADAGKTVYYILRWVNTTGETGPMSETVAATVTG